MHISGRISNSHSPKRQIGRVLGSKCFAVGFHVYKIAPTADDLADQLYNLKKSDQAMYETCISMMDKQAALIEKSPLFGEIGKSAGGHTTAGGAEAKADAKAREIMKADPNIGYDAAIAKAWTENPELMAEYDAEYFSR